MQNTELNPDIILKTLQDHFPSLRDAYSIRSLSLFGSFARNEQSDTSDVDLLVEFNEIPSLLTFVRLERDIEEFLGVDVDLVMADSLKPRIRERILRELTPV